MSEQEQHEILGRMVAEYGEIRVKLVALNSKASDLSEILRRIASGLAGDPANPHSTRMVGKPFAFLADYPTRETIEALASEIQATEKRRNELRASLKQIGFEPKD